MVAITRTLAEHRSVLPTISHVLGWIYTLAWSLSFYPQVVHNHVHKSTRGLSSDFVVLNAVGHTSYLVYNTLLLFYAPARRAYRKAHAGRDNVVQLNDFIFSLHATVLALVTLAQYAAYKKRDQRVSRPVRLGLTTALTAAVFLAGAKQLHLVTWLDVVNAASTLKLAVTMTKYIPQIRLNAVRKSTSGFAIENILLDLTGGVLSLAQLGVDAVGMQGSWSGVLGDWGKLGLGGLSIAFDAVLCWQHYVVYGPVEVRVEPGTQSDDEAQDRVTRYGATDSRNSATTAARPNQHGETERSALLR
ncbi:related to cystinosin [Sporisorium reilianum f. sp. reilianum]|uniref:Related to cystinosin n=1 Tax=Sporisorium reilianum f. sp. reilianum TaxID=72559 RepID=A0A2N8UK44_9BASI|nr:related to cystinosin [Sporisorium reilianum f. sp. reilianum]